MTKHSGNPIGEDQDDDDPLDKIIWFGKYKFEDVTFHDIINSDPDYAVWLVDECDTISDELREAINEALEEY